MILKKTKAQLFKSGKNSIINENRICMNKDMDIEICKEYKYLGIKLKFNTQYINLCNKLYMYLKNIRRLSLYINKEYIGNIYKCFIIPLLEYASVSYYHFNKTQFKK